jgi:tRNA threonylcarbamoyladenosine biosynthesis protein TsaB
VTGIAIEAATERVEILVRDDGADLAHEIEVVGHGHTRRLGPLVAGALERAGVPASALEWVAADLGPGSFTGVRVGLATAHALALAAGARLVGASSLAALAHGTRARRTLVAPLVPAGRRDLYAGFFRADAHGAITLAAAPRVGDLDTTLDAIDEVRHALGYAQVRCVGPGAARDPGRIEARYPGATSEAWRFEGLSAHDLASAALATGGPAAGLPRPGSEPRPVYVRPAQAEEVVRRRAAAKEPITLRDLTASDLPRVAEIERQIFSDPWPESFFRGEMEHPLVYARVAERGGRLAGYSVAWVGIDVGHLGNLAVVPEQRRRGVARALLEDLLAHARERRTGSLTLEVRASNDAAQALYRAYGFRLAGLRRGYYRDTGEDALIMEWRRTPD